jgi:hypothetical protein
MQIVFWPTVMEISLDDDDDAVKQKLAKMYFPFDRYQVI